MITAQQLDHNDWYCSHDNKNVWFYDSWEYEYRILTQELYYINDGFGEPEFISKITDIEELKVTYYLLEGNEMGPKS